MIRPEFAGYRGRTGGEGAEIVKVPTTGFILRLASTIGRSRHVAVRVQSLHGAVEPLVRRVIASFCDQPYESKLYQMVNRFDRLNSASYCSNLGL